jgi:F0F1-type ATP synthase assembly protein I
VLPIAAGLFGGYRLDRLLHSGPLFTLLGLALGIAAGGLAAFSTLRSTLRRPPS